MRLQTRRIEVTVKVRDLTVKGRTLTASETGDIRANNTKVVGRGEEARIFTDAIGISRDTFVGMVTGWDNALDIDGNPLECTEEAKGLVYENDPDFVKEAIATISQAVKLAKEEELKNSKPGVNGTTRQGESQHAESAKNVN